MRNEILLLLNNYLNYDARQERQIISDEFIGLLQSSPVLEFEQPVSVYEKLLILFALVPHIQPKFFDSLIQELYPQKTPRQRNLLIKKLLDAGLITKTEPNARTYLISLMNKDLTSGVINSLYKEHLISVEE